MESEMFDFAFEMNNRIEMRSYDWEPHPYKAI